MGNPKNRNHHKESDDMKKKSVKILISGLLVILWMGIVFCFSNMDTYESNSKSKGTINKVIIATVATTNKIGITDKHPTEERINQVVEWLNPPLRKCMHASIYFGLMLLLLNVFRIGNKKLTKSIIISLIICFIYACLDEYHQTFILGRTGQFRDVMIDMTGAMIATIFYLSCYKLLNFKKKILKQEKLCLF